MADADTTISRSKCPACGQPLELVTTLHVTGRGTGTISVDTSRIRAHIDICPGRSDAVPLANGPQHPGKPEPDTCHVVHVDDQPVLVRGHGDMDSTTAAYTEDVVRAAKRKFAAEHPDADGEPT